MKLKIDKKHVIATAETVEESLALIRLAHENPAPKVVKKEKMLKCEICGQKCKGQIGLGIHNARMHRGKNWTSNPTGGVRLNVIEA